MEIEIFSKIHVGPVNVQSKPSRRRGIKTVRTVRITKPPNIDQLNKRSSIKTQYNGKNSISLEEFNLSRQLCRVMSHVKSDFT